MRSKFLAFGIATEFSKQPRIPVKSGSASNSKIAHIFKLLLIYNSKYRTKTVEYSSMHIEYLEEGK
jgi:hypothetical protein